MSTLNVDKVDPSTGTDLELGTSGDTITVPSGATLTVSGTMNASSITAGTMATARLGSGTASSTTVLYGDQTYKTEPSLTGWSTDSGTNDSLVPASASAGIYLGVAAATAANLLDDYETGTWTPAGSNYTGTLGSVSANYTKIGRVVYIHLYCSTSDDTSSSGAFQITGLPFTSASSYFTSSTFHYNSPDGTAISGASVQSGNTTVRMLKKTDATSPLWANWVGSDTNEGELHFSFVYQV